ncbi:MAG: RDD family protein [Chloroflexota bacterium]
MTSEGPVLADRSLKGDYAGFASRFVAFAIDLAILVGFSAFINWVIITAMGLIGIDLLAPLGEASVTLVRSIMLIGKIALIILPILLMGAYWFFFWNITGQTVGKRIMGVRVVRIDGGRMTTSYTLRRIFMYVLGMVPFFLGFFWILLDDERRAWHDKFAGTCVIYAWDAREVDRFI